MLSKRHSRFAEKMRRLIIFAMLVLATTATRAQKSSSLRIGITEAICFGIADFSFERQISERWSIGAGTALNIKRLADEKDREYILHQEALSDRQKSSDDGGFRKDVSNTSMHVRFWHEAPFEGVSYSIGTLVKDRSGPDIFCGTGYFLRIWKGLRADIDCRICLMETIREKTFQYNSLRIGISYVF